MEEQAGQLPPPAAVGLADRRIAAMFGHLPAARQQSEERKDSPTGREQAMLQTHSAQAEMCKVLGVTMKNATTLQLLGGGLIGPARDGDGRVVRWSYWSPSRMVLIDRFRREMPPESEIELRRRFAADHGIKYAVVVPGARLAANDVREWLDAEEER